MGKTTFAVAIAFSVMGCAGGDSHAVSPWVEDGSVARASIESPTCGANATLIELPEHCLWPDSARRSAVLATQANVVVAVDNEGKPQSAHVVEGRRDASELDAAVVACAMQGRYRPAWNGAGETCPVTIRLARYPTDVAAFP